MKYDSMISQTCSLLQDFAKKQNQCHESEVKFLSVSRRKNLGSRHCAKMTTLERHTLVIGIVLTCWFGPVRSHVGLTFPQARQYDLDFLDNVRTRPPCGMPKGKKNEVILFEIFGDGLLDYFRLCSRCGIRSSLIGLRDMPEMY